MNEANFAGQLDSGATHDSEYAGHIVAERESINGDELAASNKQSDDQK